MTSLKNTGENSFKPSKLSAQGISLLSWHSATVCGMKGTGKTTLERVGFLPKYERVLCFDPNEEFRDFPNYVPETDSPRELDKVAKAVWREGNCLLLVSEAELYLPVNADMTKTPHIFKILTRGRHRNIGLFADTRRIANLNKTVFGLSEHAFIFRHFSPTDLRYLQAFIPRDCGELARLKDFCFWHYTRGEVVEHEPLKVPKYRLTRRA